MYKLLGFLCAVKGGKSVHHQVAEIFVWKKEKQQTQNISHFENESTFRKRTTFWKMKAHSETHFENEDMCTSEQTL